MFVSLARVCVVYVVKEVASFRGARSILFYLFIYFLLKHFTRKSHQPNKAGLPGSPEKKTKQIRHKQIIMIKVIYYT